MRKQSSSSVRIFYPKFDKEQLLERLKPRIEELEAGLPLLLVVLFGSYARGNYTVASDVDLLVVYQGRERKGAFAKVKKVLGVARLEPHVYSEDEYDEYKDLKRWMRRVTKDGIVLFAREGFEVTEGGPKRRASSRRS